jgi:hypothetical protein
MDSMRKTVFLIAVCLIPGIGQLSAQPVTKELDVDTQLATFKRLGFAFNPGIGESEIAELKKRILPQDKPYALLYIELGRTIEREPWTPLTDRCWDFDVEAIEDHGDYVEIIKNLERIARGAIKFENVKDYVDVEAEKAWVSFSVRGVKYKWDLRVDNDWVDETLFTRIVQLTNKLKTEGKFTYFDTGGQNAVIGFETPAKRAEIVKATGLEIIWLS